MRALRGRESPIILSYFTREDSLNLSNNT